MAQVGSIEAANARFAARNPAVSGRGAAHAPLVEAELGQLTQVTRGIQSKVKFAGAPLTILGTAARSAAAPAALTPTFRRVTRARGPLARYIDTPARAALSNLVANGATIRDFRRQYVEPDGVASLSATAQSGISAAAAAKVLGVPVAQALAQMSARATRFNQSPARGPASRAAGDVEAGEGGLRSRLVGRKLHHGQSAPSNAGAHCVAAVARRGARRPCSRESRTAGRPRQPARERAFIISASVFQFKLSYTETQRINQRKRG